MKEHYAFAVCKENGIIYLADHKGTPLTDEFTDEVISICMKYKKTIKKNPALIASIEQKIINFFKPYHEKFGENEHRRRKISDKKKRTVLSIHGAYCLCCGIDENITMDHIVPLSRGGSDKIDNLQPLCGSCNKKKKDKIIDYRKTQTNVDTEK